MKREGCAMRRKAQNVFKTPKGLVTIVLLTLIALATWGQGVRAVLAGLVSSSIVAGLTDLLILRVRKKTWEFPSGAILTAIIVTMVLRAQEPWYVTAITAEIGVLSKYVLRSRSANVFNPAALAIIVSFYLFHTAQNWWGALTDVTPIAKLLLLGCGAFIVDRVNKMPLVITFLAAYFLLFTVTAFVTDPLPVAEIFRTPDVEAVLYFAFFILTDPPTSPAKYRDQLICGLIVAIVSYALFELAGVVYYLLAGVLVGNVWEAWRRVNRRSRSTFPRGLGTFLTEVAPWNQGRN
jgi:Na+-translocating ferredoxin:NAD+ oxidoreductase RnfD subunit